MDKEIVHAVLDKMGDMLNIKVIAGAVLGLVTHKYSILMIGFGVLLYLDILTKWIAISYAYLVEQTARRCAHAVSASCSFTVSVS